MATRGEKTEAYRQWQELGDDYDLCRCFRLKHRQAFGWKPQYLRLNLYGYDAEYWCCTKGGRKVMNTGETPAVYIVRMRKEYFAGGRERQIEEKPSTTSRQYRNRAEREYKEKAMK